MASPELAVAPTADWTLRVRRAVPGLLATAILAIGGLALFLPFLWMLATSMRLPTDAYDLPPTWLPWPVSRTNYVAAINGPVPLLQNMWNSLVIAVAVSAGQLITAPIAGYAFAKLRFPGRDALFIVLLTALMVPIQVTIIPLFILMRNFGLMNNPLALILPSLTGAFGIFLMRQFFLTVPDDLIEAAKIDGASPWRTFRYVALPLAKGTMAALGVIVFLGSWNAYFAPQVFLSDIDTATMPLALVLLLGPYKSGNVAVIMAATTIAIVPALVVFLLAQRWIIESLTRTGIKG